MYNSINGDYKLTKKKIVMVLKILAQLGSLRKLAKILHKNMLAFFTASNKLENKK